MTDRDKAEKTEGAETKTIQLRFSRESRKALENLYALVGYEHCPVINAIETVARQAFIAGQQMTKYKHRA